MKILVVQIVWFILCLNSLNGQSLLPDSLELDSTPILPYYNGIKNLETLPTNISLRQLTYCPSPFDQEKLNYCVPFACSYGAFTIEKRIPQVQNTLDAYSAAYIFNSLNLRGKSQITTVLDFMRDSGVCRINQFPNKLYGVRTIPAKAREQAKAPFNRTAYSLTCKRNTQNIAYLIKKSLSQYHPVIIGVLVEPNFREKYKHQMKWQPVAARDSHAMVIVGYNDNKDNGVFEVMNSYGTNWGNSGFIEISYTDLTKVLICAYILTPPSGKKGNEDEPANVTTVDSTRFEVLANIQLKRYMLNQDSTYFFKTIESVVKENTQAYQVEITPSWEYKLYQLEISDIPRGKYLYVFSLDSMQTVNIHWPPNERWGNMDTTCTKYYAPDFGNTPASAAIAFDNISLTIPSPTEGLKIKYKGEDQIIILIADIPLPDFKTFIRQFKSEQITDAKERVQKILGLNLAKTNDILFMRNTMTIKKRAYITHGSIVPVFLTLINEN